MRVTGCVLRVAYYGLLQIVFSDRFEFISQIVQIVFQIVLSLFSDRPDRFPDRFEVCFSDRFDRFPDRFEVCANGLAVSM